MCLVLFAVKKSNHEEREGHEGGSTHGFGEQTMAHTGGGLMARKQSSVQDDPVVREVREARQKLWQEAGGTIEGLLRLLDERVPKRRKRSSRKRRAKA